MINILIEVIAGLFLGLLGAPIIFYTLGAIVVQFKASNNIKQAEALKKQHNADIKRIKVNYEKQQKHFNKIAIKTQKLLARAKEAQLCE